MILGSIQGVLLTNYMALITYGPFSTSTFLSITWEQQECLLHVKCYLAWGLLPSTLRKPPVISTIWSTKRLCISSVAQSCLTLCNPPWTTQQARSPCPSPTPRIHPNPCPLCQWCHPTISSSVITFSSCTQSFPASGSFKMNKLSTSGGQSIGVSASTSIPPMNTQDWSPLGWTGWISLQSKGLSRVFSNTTVQKHQFINAQLSL